MGLFGTIFGKKSAIYCARCDEAVGEGNVKGHNGKVYCAACYRRILEQEKQAQARKEEEKQVQAKREADSRAANRTIHIDTTHDYTKAPVSVQQIRDSFGKADIKYRVNHFGDQWEVVVPINAKQNQFDLKFLCKDSGGAVAMRVFSLAHIEDRKLEQVYPLLNKLQNTYRFLRFTLDADNSLKLEYDMTSSTPNVGEVAVELVIRTAKIVDHMYPELMKCIWS